MTPRYWPTWIGIGLLVLIAWLPHRIRLFCGAVLGRILFLLAKERRYITAINIRLCFPELSETEQASLVKRAFIDSGIGLIETATGWVRSSRHFEKMVVWKNRDVLTEAKAEGRGVLILGAHYSTLDLGANLLAPFCPFAVTYRPHKNPLFDAFMYKGRLSNCTKVFDRYDIRGTFRHLKKGEVLWYAPDQDYGPEHAVFAPFFGNQAATITAPASFAAINNSPVIIARQTRLADGSGYELEGVRVPSSVYPSGDAVKDATLINAYLEKAIRHAPEQYLWMHKRFKTQPGGKPESPYIFIRSPIGKLKEDQYRDMTAQADAVTTVEHDKGSPYLALESGLYLRKITGDMKRTFARGIPHRIDKYSKILRAKGIDTLTVDKWFRLPGRRQSVLLCHLPSVESLGFYLQQEKAVDWAALGRFIQRCHEQGVNLASTDPATLLVTKESFALAFPEDVHLHPFSLCYLDRSDNLRHFTETLATIKPECESDTTIMIDAYLDGCSDTVSRNMKPMPG